MLGLRSRPSSRSVNEALGLLNAVGGDKAKTKIIEEIKKAQEAYEKVVLQSKEERKNADQALQEARTAKKAAEAARQQTLQSQADAEAKIEVLREGLNKRIEEVTRKENILEARIREFENKMKKETVALNERNLVVSDLEAKMTSVQNLASAAETLRRDYEKRLAKLKAIVNE